MKAKSNKKRSWGKGKPPVPYPDFPLSPSNSGYWQKKIRGRIVYFGAWGKKVGGKLVQLPNGGEWKKALIRFQEEKDDLYAGRPPHQRGSRGTTLKELCNEFHAAKWRAYHAKEIQQDTYEKHKATTDMLIKYFGKLRDIESICPEHFADLRAEMTKQYGPVALGNAIQRVKTVFKFGYDNRLYDKAVRFGSEFKKPTAKVLRVHKARQKTKNGPKMLEPEEVRTMLESAEPIEKAMILLGVNGGMTARDLSLLPINLVDLKKGWIDFPRPKTGVERRVPLWPETIEALKEAIELRPTPRWEESKPLVFLTVRGRPFLCRDRSTAGIGISNLMKKVGVHRPRIGASALRHTFQTLGDEIGDYLATRHIMGHVDSSISGVYRERIVDARLKAVSDHVRSRILPEEKKAEAKGGDE